MILRSGSGNETTQNNKADDATEYNLHASIISEFGEHELGGLWIPDMTIRTAELSGGGQRVIAGGNVIVFGTDKHDRIDAGHDSYVSGGAGNDQIYAREGSVAFGDDGDDIVVGDFGSVVSGGAGNDHVLAGWNGIAFGDEGDDTVTALAYSEAYGGEGNDTVTAGSGSLADGGVGNDNLIGQGGYNTLIGGRGNDRLDLVQARDSTILYHAGDGHDTIILGDYWRRAQSTGAAPKNTLSLGPGISAADTRIEISGYTATISFAGNFGDQITINFEDNSTLTIAFADGTSRELNWTKRGGFEPTEGSTEAKYFEF